MDLNLPPGPAHFRSPPRRAGAAAEIWAETHLYCPACSSNSLTSAPTNAKVYDFECPACHLRLQLKAKAGRFGSSFVNSAYAPKLEAIRARKLPDYALLSYDARGWRVTDLTFIPGHFIGEAQVIARPPLPPTARRAGWVGSNVRIGGLPPDAFVRAITDSQEQNEEVVRAHYARFRWLGGRRAESAGWTADVLREVRAIAPVVGMSFTLADVYEAAEDRLAKAHSSNHHVRDKIRQQLQVLRDHGVLAFEGRGRYRILA